MAEPGVTLSNPVRDVCDYDLLFDCVHCGLCAEACPTYVVTRCEMDSPRGRIYLMKSLAEGRIELDDDAARHLDLCLGCRGCETACPSGVHYGRLIEGARSFVERNHRRSFADRLKRRAVSAIFPVSKIASGAARAAEAGRSPWPQTRSESHQPHTGFAIGSISFLRLKRSRACSPRRRQSRRAPTHRLSWCITDASRKCSLIRKI